MLDKFNHEKGDYTQTRVSAIYVNILRTAKKIYLKKYL